MEIAPMVNSATITTTNNPPVPDPDSPEPEIEAPSQIQPAKPIPFSNGKRHHHQLHHAVAVAVTYGECLKNHAAGIGGHALDGCGEFMPSSSSVPSDPTSLKCAACGCHRNFHRRDDPSSIAAAATAIEFRPQNRHQLPPPRFPLPPPDDDSASPPPISSSYMLLALSGSKNSLATAAPAAAVVPVSHKRFRTKFSLYQKERMLEFAERVGWRMPKADDLGVREFCRQIGVDKGVFKVWMHNNKNYGNGRGAARRSTATGGSGAGGEEKAAEINLGGGGVATNGSSSTS